MTLALASLLLVLPLTAAESSAASGAPLLADDNPEEAPGEAKPGRPYQWKSTSTDTPFEYFVPKTYDPEQGANLTVVLHGNGLDHRWSFWNHPVGEFRKSDILVSPDGFDYVSGTNANEFLGNREHAGKFHDFLDELKAQWNIKHVYLYGHSQGSFFVFYFAGEYPQDINGVCGHASGVWAQTQHTKKGHHIAVGVMHGTDDHIPYGQGWYGAETYRDARYPLVHLRTLFDWPHRPNYFQAESVLSWCEGMTETDPARVEACLEYLAQPKLPMGADWSALYAVAARLAELEAADAGQIKRAEKVMAAVDALADDHVAAILKSLGKKGRLKAFEKGEWLGTAIRFLEEFEGVPAHAAFLAKNGKTIERVRKAGTDAYSTYYKEKDDEQDEAFDAGLEMLEEGWVHYRCKDVLAWMEELADDRDFKLSKKKRKQFETLAKAWKKGREDGFRKFTQRNEKARP